MEYALPLCDKDLFVQFRENKITFAQFFSRVAARCGIAKYTVYDDLKPILDPAIK